METKTDIAKFIRHGVIDRAHARSE